MKSEHLSFVNQSYIGHLCNAWRYSFLSCKASMCFFIHGIFPDTLQFNGGEIIQDIADEIHQTAIDIHYDIHYPT